MSSTSADSTDSPAEQRPVPARTSIAFDEGRNSYKVSGPKTFLIKDELKKLNGRFFGRGDRSFWAVPGEFGRPLEILVEECEAGKYGELPPRKAKKPKAEPNPERAATKKARVPGDVQILGAPGRCPLRDRVETPLDLAEFPATISAGREAYQVVLYLVPKPVVGLRVRCADESGEAAEKQIFSAARSRADGPFDSFTAGAPGALETFRLDGAKFRRVRPDGSLGEAATFFD